MITNNLSVLRRIALKTTFLLMVLLFSKVAESQTNPKPMDSFTGMKYLPVITLVGDANKRDLVALPEIVGTHIYAGKKNALVIMDNLNTVVVNNNMRQIFAKIAGINVWESDGSGIQIGIAARGLSPNRSWEFNIRQNGCDISADPFGYPEAYYNPQLQAVQRIQVVRGAGALQYGPQFGGMINYVMRDGSDIRKPIQLEAQQSLGSFGLLNSFVALGGEKKKWHYYAFYDTRRADGWRQNSRYETQTGFASVTYKISQKMKLNGEFMKYSMVSQQPGGLTDEQFKTNPRLSSRSRNWFNTPWMTAALKYDWELSSRNRLQIKIFTLAGDRNSVGFLAPVNVQDSINKSLLAYNPREVASDFYRNMSVEGGYLRDYKFMGKNSTLSAGVRYFRGKTQRLSKGKGTTGSSADFTIIESSFPGDVTYETSNYALYAENVFRPVKNLLIIPGARLENILVSGKGRLSYNQNGSENLMKPENRRRSFILYGIGAEYHCGTKHHNEFYANFTQAYRPILFSNITSPTTDIVDPALKDSKGWNSDLGFRGMVFNFIYIDAGIYYLQYNDRVGSVTRLANNQTYKYITNLGNSHSYGIESLIDLDLISGFAPAFSKKYGSLPIFIAYNYNVSEYEDYKIISVSNNQEIETNLKGNAVEYAPKNVIRAGLSYKRKNLLATLQSSHTSSVFTDAGNTTLPAANGQTGMVPEYTVYDIMTSYQVSNGLSVKFSINNITNTSYFTRRAGGYPGPGILPSDGRNFLINISIKI